MRLSGMRKSTEQEPSDPIQAFSSPTAAGETRRELDAPLGPRFPSPKVLKNEAESRRRAKELAEFKRRAAARSASVVEDEDDLVVEDAVPKSGLIEKRPNSRHARVVESLRRGSRATTAGHAEGSITIAQLNRQLLEGVHAANRQVVARKEEEWKKRGGRLQERIQGDGLEVAFRVYAEKAEKAKESVRVEEAQDDEQGSDDDRIPDHESDQIFSPARGSASPMQRTPTDNDGDISTTETLDDDDEDKENVQPRRRAPVHRIRLTLDSDDEGNGRSPTPPLGRVLVPETSVVLDEHGNLPRRPLSRQLSLSSFGSDNDEEKENQQCRMWDQSEDKENKAVVRHELLLGDTVDSNLGLPRTSLGQDGGVLQDLGAHRGLLDSDNEIEEKKAREPLAELYRASQDEDDDVSLSPVSTPVLTPFMSRLTQSQGQSNTTVSEDPPSPTLKPFLPVDGGGGSFDFDENSFGDGDGFQPLKPAFGSLFEDGTQKASPSSGFRPLFGSKLQRAPTPDLEDLPLTFDVGLAPALEVSESKRRQADSIFEKEQGYLVEGFELELKKNKRQEPEIYVNDHGFLTQTKPDVSTPEVYRMVLSPATQSQRPGTALRFERQRRPLQTLSLVTEEPQDSPKSLKRLRKIRSPIEDPFEKGGYRSSPSPSPTHRPTNAFALLTRKVVPHRRGGDKPLKPSEFVEAEAVESDDDELRGFGMFGTKTDQGDEDGDGEDLDATLTELVDDKEMKEEEVGKDKILEKHQEHLAEDDSKLQKLHTDVIEGKFRTKRRNRGVDFSDSEDDDDDEESRAIRRKMRKKRKIDGDTLDALAEDDETRAFYDAYHQPLVDDDNPEFDYLQQGEEGVGAAGENDDEEEELDERGQISIHEARALAARVARQNQVVESFDPQDVSWADGTLSDEEGLQRVRVRDTSVVTKTAARRAPLGDADFDGYLERRHVPPRNPKHQLREAEWAARERKARSGGTARSAAGAAVTGHAKPKPKVERDASRLGASSSGTSVAERRRTVKAPSILSKVSDRSGRFA